MSEAQDDAPPPEADSDHDHEGDTAPQDHADDSPWYMPRITTQDLPPQDHPEDAHAPAPKLSENTSPSSRFDDAPPADRSTSTTRNTGSSPSPNDLRDAFLSPTPDTPTGKAPAQDNSTALPRGRIFEKRLPPGLRGQSSDQFQSLADKPEYHDLVYRSSSQEDEQDQRGGFFQNVVDTRTTRQSPSRPQAPQTFAQNVRPAAQPQAQAQQPAANPAQNAPAASQSPAPAPPKLRNYFVFPRGENVVILYNKKAVENLYWQFSSGTAMEQQGLRMLQDYSGSTSNPRLIDISDPGWVRKLEALAAANKDKGGFTHLAIIDHGTRGDQRFGVFPGSYEHETALTPESAAWRIISSVMAPDGHIHFAGCYVGRAQAGQDYLNDLLRSLGKGTKITIDAVTGPMFNLQNAFEGDLIQAQPTEPTQPSPLP
jgi:hypothetical protein